MDSRISRHQKAEPPQPVVWVVKVRPRSDPGHQIKDQCLQSHLDHHREDLANLRLYLTGERFHLAQIQTSGDLLES